MTRVVTGDKGGIKIGSIFFVALCCTVFDIRACGAVRWVGAVGAIWTEASSWSDGLVPSGDSVVEIGPGLPSTGEDIVVSLPVGPVKIKNLAACPPAPQNGFPARAVVLVIGRGSELDLDTGLNLCTGAGIDVFGGSLGLSGGASEVSGNLTLGRHGLAQGLFNIRVEHGASLTIKGKTSCEDCSARVAGTVEVLGILQASLCSSTQVVFCCRSIHHSSNVRVNPCKHICVQA